MKTIFCGWELGNELSHLSHLAELSRLLSAREQNVAVALRDLSRPHFFFRKQTLPILQAPVWQFPVQLDRPVICLADVLMMKGYLYDTTLRNLVHAWQALLDLVKPDLVVCDYAPTLLLALWQTEIPRVVMGTGFADPLPGTPMRDWRPGAPRDGVVQRQEKRLLETVNTVLESQGKSPLQYFSDLYRADFTVIKTLPELDLHHRTADDRTLFCVPQSAGNRDAARWIDGTGPRIFAYLSPEHPQWDTLISALKHCHGRVFLHCPGDKRERLKSCDEGRFRLSTDNVDMTASLREADLFIGHGSMTSVAQALVAGVPVLSFPIQLEQLLNGQNVQRLGAGACIAKPDSVDDATRAINRALADSAMRQRAQQIAAQAQSLPTHNAMAIVADYCVKLAAGRAAHAPG